MKETLEEKNDSINWDELSDYLKDAQSSLRLARELDLTR